MTRETKHSKAQNPSKSYAPRGPRPRESSRCCHLHQLDLPWALAQVKVSGRNIYIRSLPLEGTCELISHPESSDEEQEKEENDDDHDAGDDDAGNDARDGDGAGDGDGHGDDSMSMIQ